MGHRPSRIPYVTVAYASTKPLRAPWNCRSRLVPAKRPRNSRGPVAQHLLSRIRPGRRQPGWERGYILVHQARREGTKDGGPAHAAKLKRR